MGEHSRYLTGELGKQTRPKIIELRQLTVLHEHVPVLQEISLDIFEGEALVLLGQVEAGKHALLACLLGQIQPARGKISVMGVSVPPLPAETRRQIGVMPQFVERKTSETVAAYLQRFAAYYDVKLTGAQISHYCAHYQLPPGALVAELSTLQARVLALALTLVHDPRLALLVEPLSGLAPADQEAFQVYLLRTRSEGRTLLCTFTPPLAEKYILGYDGVVKLAQGRIVRQNI
ncbi:MAG TPA: ATP-binding cassette domain-containing protein [Ktedonobacteraceae bacterium]